MCDVDEALLAVVASRCLRGLRRSFSRAFCRSELVPRTRSSPMHVLTVCLPSE